MKARVLALYLPQFHPIEENDRWWGKGFTEWTNVGKAKRYFPGHYQPRVPADLGYYDLRVPETRKAQADMARRYGVEGFIYWHYWFGNGKRLLERPFNEVLASGEPDFPFALAWANETWKGFAHGLTNRNTLIEQQYPGEEDYIAHFYAVLPAFKDKRYVTVDGKPIFMIYKPHQLPDAKQFIELWQGLAKKNGLPGIYFVAHHQSRKDHAYKTEQKSVEEFLEQGFDAVNFVRLTAYLEHRSTIKKIKNKIWRKVFRYPLICRYDICSKYFSNAIDGDDHVIPTIIPAWDHTPRSGREGLVFGHSTPDLFGKHVREVIEQIVNKPDEHKLVILKSWNEWAEGNYMEPDLKWGHEYLKALKAEL
mgnify:CR=1 FL=1